MREAPPIQRVESGRSAVFVSMSAVAIVTGAAVIFLFNPAHHTFYPRCLLKALTGLNCPGCGGLRATHQLLHGHVREAVKLNALFVLSLPIVTFFIARGGMERWTGRKWPRLFSTGTALWLGAAIVIAYGVLRNFPWRAWFGG